jgi:hypothetical protein
MTESTSTPGAEVWFCEHSPYPGAGYHCNLDAGHDGPHSDLTIMWNDAGHVCNADGSVI